MAARRPERVAHLIQARLAGLLLSGTNDPRLQHVVVTGVEMSADLRVARVYFRIFGDAEPPEAAQQALRRAEPFLRGALGRGLGLRVTPELRFEYDVVPDRAQRVDDLLRAAGPPAPEEEDDS